MSLYRHIRDKDDLLDEVVDRLLTDLWRPATAEDDWRAWTIEAATRLRDFLVGQPAALHVYFAHPVVSPAAVDRMNAMMRRLRCRLPGRAGRGRYPRPHRNAAGTPIRRFAAISVFVAN
jgi:AcrR family transcriptional regulator